MTRKAKHSLLPTLILNLLAAPGMADGAAFFYPPDVSLPEVAERIERASHEHPRLFATADDFAALRASREAEGPQAALAGVIIHQADLLLDAAPVQRKLEGRRLLSQCTSRCRF